MDAGTGVSLTKCGIYLAGTGTLGLRMCRRSEALLTVVLVILSTPFASTQLAAQWVNYPNAGVPRKLDGNVNMSAPAPRMAGGKPDFSGTWTSDEIDPRHPDVPPNPHDATTSRRNINLGVELKEDYLTNLGLRHS